MTEPKFVMFWCLQRHKKNPRKLGFSPPRPCGFIHIFPGSTGEELRQNSERCVIYLEAALSKETPKIME